jgi:hypothetical protein
MRSTVKDDTRLVVVMPVQAADRRFVTNCAIVVVASVAITVYACESMSGGVPMRGGWTMSMAWMRTPDQSLLAATTLFMGTWIAMITASMSPVLLMALLRFRRGRQEFCVTVALRGSVDRKRLIESSKAGVSEFAWVYIA